MARYLQLRRLTAPLNLKADFISSKNSIRKIFPFIINVQKLPTKFHLALRIFLIHSTEAWNLRFPIIVSQNTIKASFKNSSPAGILSCVLEILSHYGTHSQHLHFSLNCDLVEIFLCSVGLKLIT